MTLSVIESLWIHISRAFFVLLYVPKGSIMPNKNIYDMHYKCRKDVDTVEVYKPGKFRMSFPGYKGASHKGNDIEIVTPLNYKIKIDQNGRKWL